MAMPGLPLAATLAANAIQHSINRSHFLLNRINLLPHFIGIGSIGYRLKQHAHPLDKRFASHATTFVLLLNWARPSTKPSNSQSAIRCSRIAGTLSTLASAHTSPSCLVSRSAVMAPP